MWECRTQAFFASIHSVRAKYGVHDCLFGCFYNCFVNNIYIIIRNAFKIYEVAFGNTNPWFTITGTKCNNNFTTR